MRAHQAKDRDELTHEDVYGPSQLKADMFNTVCVSWYQLAAPSRGRLSSIVVHH